LASSAAWAADRAVPVNNVANAVAIKNLFFIEVLLGRPPTAACSMPLNVMFDSWFRLRARNRGADADVIFHECSFIAAVRMVAARQETEGHERTCDSAAVSGSIAFAMQAGQLLMHRQGVGFGDSQHDDRKERC
jgi:hypothetical protein